MASMNRTPRFILISGWGIGSGTHIINASESARIGAMMNMEVDDVRGRKGSLVNSFRASAIGCSSPYGPTMLGPLRSCM